MRLDRVLTLGVFHPLARWTGESARRLPILMYHSVSKAPENGVHPYYQTKTRPEIFGQQMSALRELGYQGIDLESAIRSWAKPEFWNGKQVVITFDDGFRDFLTDAYPWLKKNGFSATVFLPTGFIGKDRRSFKGIDCLTWQEVQELRREGMRFGSHAVNHLPLHELSREEVEHEIKDSKGEIEQQLQEPVTTFSFPYAFPQTNRAYVEMATGLLEAAGYECAVMTRLARADLGENRFQLPRLPVNSLDDRALLQAKLDGGYDWLAQGQVIKQTCKRWMGR